MKNKQFTIFLILGLVVILIAIFAPYIAPMDPYEAEMTMSLEAPNDTYIWGTDKLGRDLCSRVIYGTRISVSMTFILLGIIFIAGTTLGIISGYFGGFIGEIIMRLTDIMISFPSLIMAIAVAGLLGPSMKNSVIAIAVVSWTKYARLSRSLVLKMKDRGFIDSAKVIGTKNHNIILKHIIPNIIPTLIITVAADVGVMMLELASLSFLGFGAQMPTPEWGLMLNEGRTYISQAPWLMIYPGIAIIVVVVIFNMLGESIRGILDPRD